MTDTDTTAALLAAYDAQMRSLEPSTPAPGVTYEHDGPLLRVVGEHRGFVGGRHDWGGLRGRELDAQIARQRDFFAARGEAVEWKVCAHDTPADLTDRLRAAGFEPEPEETVLIAPAGDLATASPVLPTGVTLRRVTDDADLDRIAGMETAVWGEDMTWLAEHLRGLLTAEPDVLEIYVAEAGGEVVSAAWVEIRPDTDFAMLLGGSTLAEWRGKGVYRALVALRAARATAGGAAHLLVEASPDSTPILERLGFKAVTTTTPYVWTPAT
ncbi:GNAT family N-acetyltransferase [Streptomyces arenae]|uniref:GNAT family N-acetyltransferase n=1 Tax=Streptomyces arenae TaxID=29301 RepID=UPI002658A797|nr:GNAT family N-acetyltransferase [Streptomyces arenae]MCG7208042.1 GNAT family N-acetyltransferase [Streptomyces arenae]